MAKKSDKDKAGSKGKASDKKDDVVYLEGIENSVIENKIRDVLDGIDSEMEFGDALDIFIRKANNVHATKRIETPEGRMNYAVGIIITKAKAGRSFAAKPTIPISCVMRNVGGIKNNYTNVTEATHDMTSNDDKIGIAGPWRRCLDCGRKWDTEDEKYGTNCPGCSSTSSVVMANQAVPNGTQGIVNRQEMKMGDISGFNKTRTSIFVYSEDTGETDEAFLSFSGKQRVLLKRIQLGRPFNINIQANDIYVNETTGIVSYETTGTSKVSECSVEDFPDILEIYDDIVLPSVAELENGAFCALFLEVVEEAKQPKEDGKWIVQLSEPVEDEDSEPMLVNAYFDDEDVAKQLSEDDQGIFECRYSEMEVTVNGETEISRTINVQPEVCGLPIFILGEDGTKLLSV